MTLVPFPGSAKSGALQLPPDDDEEEQSDLGGRMTFLEHLEELRKRIINACLSVLVGVIAGFFFIQEIYDFLLAPALATLPEGSHLIYTQPTEAFALYIQISLISGAVIASPAIMYQVWKFIAPGLYANEKRFVIPFVLFSSGGFIAGAAFNHYVAYRFIMTYLASFNSASLLYMPQLSYVFGLYVRMLLGLGLVFQMPTLVFFLARMRVVTARFLVAKFKYAVLFIVIAAAIIPPTGDPTTLMVFVAPMLLLYALSVAIAWVVAPRKDEGEAPA
jgi:sec-independent protein translocase protein TatC